MLLSSPSFSGFLDNLSTNPNAAAPQQPQRQQPTPPAVVEQRQPENHQSQIRKDVNPYAVQQQQDININYTMLPEQQPMDFSMLDLNNNNDFIYQPQVFSVHNVPEISIDTSILSGKPSHFSKPFESEDDKVDLPIFTSAATKPEPDLKEADHVDEEFDSNPSFTLFAPSSSPAASNPLDLDTTSIIANIKPAKAFLHYELVDSAEAEQIGIVAMTEFQRLCSSLDAVTARLEALTVDL